MQALLEDSDREKKSNLSSLLSRPRAGATPSVAYELGNPPLDGVAQLSIADVLGTASIVMARLEASSPKPLIADHIIGRSTMGTP
jgi:hypothetical protein